MLFNAQSSRSVISGRERERERERESMGAGGERRGEGRGSQKIDRSNQKNLQKC